MNRVQLIGRLTRDPELRSTGSGLSVASFSIAVQRNFTNQNGERGTDFINCVAWRKQAENLTKYCKKGAQVAVEGRITTGSYQTEDGTKRYTTDVTAESITFLDTKNNNISDREDFAPDNMLEQETTSSVTPTDISDDPFKDFGEEVVLSDDELPF